MSNISLVEAVSGSDINGTDVTLNFARALENDVAVVFGGYSTLPASAPTAPTGYTEIHTSGADPRVGMWYKVMGATPDTSVTCDGGGEVTESVAYTVFILRGVDTSNVMDVTAVEAALHDPPSITPSTSGALVVAATATNAPDASVGTTDQEMFFIHHSEPGDLNDISFVVCFYHWSSGAFNPPDVSTLSSGSGSYSITAAFRPAASLGGGFRGSLLRGNTG